jgi:2-amino-4-hydroxy-6-hydroxymethyldihydropteridine diphosphokinase
MPVSLISLGSNVGNRQETLAAAVLRLSRLPGVRMLAQSHWRETAPIGGPADQSNFLNGAIALQNNFAPLELLAQLQNIETTLGRKREQRWGPRTLDLDLLLHGETVLKTPELVVPHPRMAVRRFVLEPAAETAGAMVHPTIGWSVAQLLEHLNHSQPYVAIAGPIAAGKTHLAERLALAVPASLISERPDWRQLNAFYAAPAQCGFETESAFLEDRSDLLARGNPLWEEHRWAVSDFWFDQSAAFARAWLRPDEFRVFSEQFAAAKKGVMRPRLTLLLDATADELLARVRHRGRDCERPLTADSLDRIRRELFAQLAMPDVGPTLQLSGDADAVFAEAVATMRGME